MVYNISSISFSEIPKTLMPLLNHYYHLLIILISCDHVFDLLWLCEGFQRFVSVKSLQKNSALVNLHYNSCSSTRALILQSKLFMISRLDIFVTAILGNCCQARCNFNTGNKSIVVPNFSQ